MKNLKILGLIAAMVMVFASCSTNDEDPAGLRGVAVVPEITDLNPAVFDSNDMENTFVQFTVKIPDGESVSSGAVQVSYNGQKERVDYTTLNSFPATVKIPLADLATKLGMSLSDVKLGDVFTIEVLTTSNGKTYRSNASIDAAVVCAYNPDLVSGSYHAKSADWGSEGDVTITVDPTDQYTVYVSGLEAIEGLNEDQGPLKMMVNPLDYSVTAVKTVLASDAWGYHNLAYAGSGKLSTCDGTYTMNFAISVDDGDFGTYSFVLTKN